MCASPTVSRLLSLIQPTDRGIQATQDARARIDQLISTLEAEWRGSDPFEPSLSQLLLRNAEVCYVGQSSSKNANAAGGKYRGAVGRAVFRTENLFQHVLACGIAVNVVQFRLLGLLPGQAILRGAWKRASQEELPQLQRNSTRQLSPNTIAVDFESPRVAFGRGGRVLNLQFGPASRVGLDITYLDETVDS